MIILHNIHSRDSREFVETYGDGNVVIDWYNGGREHFESCANHKAICTFPVVLVHVPSHKYQWSLETEDDADADIETEDVVEPEILDIAAHQRITQKLASLEDVQKVIDEVNETLAKSEALGLEVAPLTMDDLDIFDEYYQDK